MFRSRKRRRWGWGGKRIEKYKIPEDIKSASPRTYKSSQKTTAASCVSQSAPIVHPWGARRQETPTFFRDSHTPLFIYMVLEPLGSIVLKLQGACSTRHAIYPGTLNGSLVTRGEGHRGATFPNHWFIAVLEKWRRREGTSVYTSSPLQPISPLSWSALDQERTSDPKCPIWTHWEVRG